MMKRLLAITLSIGIAACAQAQGDLPFNVEPVSEFDEPWAMDFLPDGRMLVTEKKGNLYVINESGQRFGVRGMPDVDYGGQGGLGDVAVHPDFEDNGLIYLSYSESGVGGTRGAAVARGVLDVTDGRGSVSGLEVVWRQYPKVFGQGHYGHRIVFHDGYMWISSGDRQKFTPSQDMQTTMGKIVRLNDDGSVPNDNPFVGYRDRDAFVDNRSPFEQIWSLGHRNPLGIAFDLDGQLWNIEMGPSGGDELNRVVRGGNYGYPVVSNGDHYDGREIPDHDTDDSYLPPAAWWTPVISPGNLIAVSGEQFSDWRGNLLVAGLSSQAIIRIEIDGDGASEVERYPMGARIRSVEEAADGTLWVLEDERAGSQGRLLKLTPK